MLKLDNYDLKILSAVQRDGRISKSALAEAIGLSASPSWTRLKRLEEAGVIVGRFQTEAQQEGLVFRALSLAG